MNKERNTLKMLKDCKIWRSMKTPYMSGKVYACTILTLCIIAILIIHMSTRPRIRKGNINIENAYGAEGVQHLPQAIIIGVRKGGTRAILSYLKGHPGVRIAKSEVHFFDAWRNWRQGLEWYRRLMPYSHQGQVTIEKTPAYFHTPGVAGAIHQMNSSMKLILVVRDPVQRAISDFVHVYRKLWWVMAPTGYYKFENVADPNGLWNGFLWRSTYIEILKEWLKFFPKEQILIVDGGGLIADPITEMYKIENFLGVKHYLDKDMFVFNNEKHFYCLKDERTKKQHCLGDTKGRPHPEVDPKVKGQLVEYFRPYNEELFKLIGKKFDWDGV